MASNNQFRSFAASFNSILKRWTRANIHTTDVGLVDTYDAATQRAKIIPAMLLINEDGTIREGTVWSDVPVLVPGGTTTEITNGTPVLLVHMKRSIANWKSNVNQQTTALPGTLWPTASVVAIAGFTRPTKVGFFDTDPVTKQEPIEDLEDDATDEEVVTAVNGILTVLRTYGLIKA